MDNNGWHSCMLGEFVTLQRGHDLPETQRRPGGVPVMGSFGLTGWHDISRTRGPGVTVGRSGASIGVVNYSPVAFWPLNTCLYVINFHGNDERFAYYFLKSLDLARFNAGSAQPSLNRNHIHPLPIRIPALDEQRQIACLLGVLDDKIKHNRRMNETLEGLARAIFKSWFVDFDPVVAKAAGRRPIGMSAAVAAMFPWEFDDSTMGQIPRGWRVDQIRSIAQNARIGVQPNEVSSDTPYIGLEHIPRKQWTIDEWGTATDAISGKFRFSAGDILFGKLRPYFHKVCIAPLHGVCSTDVLVIRAQEPSYFGFVLGHAASVEMIDFVDGASSGTRMPRCRWDDIARFVVALPPPSLAAAFTQLVNPVVSRMRASVSENRTLGAVRDTLLAKLMSGEIRLRQGEKLVEEFV